MLNYPNIDRNKTAEQNFEEIKSWAYQLIDQLNYEINRLESEKKGEENG